MSATTSAPHPCSVPAHPTALMDLPIRDVPLAILDLEMTGLREEDEPIEIAIAHLDPGQPLPRLVFHSRVRPGIEMSRGATRVTGITDADLSEAPDWREVSGRLRILDATTQGILRDRIVLAFNAPNDFRWLSRAQATVGALAPAWPWLDALVLVKSLDRYEKQKTLGAACARAGIVLDAHGAAGDALATALLWRSLQARLPSYQQTQPLRDYLEWQGATAVFQEEDFCRYIQRTYGTRGERPECPWHWLEGVTLPDWPAPVQTWGRCAACGETGIRYHITQAGELTPMSISRDQDLAEPACIPHVCAPPKPDAPTLEEGDDYGWHQDDEEAVS